MKIILTPDINEVDGMRRYEDDEWESGRIRETEGGRRMERDQENARVASKRRAHDPRYGILIAIRKVGERRDGETPVGHLCDMVSRPFVRPPRWNG